jgi:hypothetical protein
MLRVGGVGRNEEIGTNSAFSLGLRKTKENLDRVARSEDFSEAYRLLPSTTLSIIKGQLVKAVWGNSRSLL